MKKSTAEAVLPVLLAVAAFVGLHGPALALADSPATQPSAVLQTENVRIELSADRHVVRPGEELRLTVSFKLLQPDLYAYGNDMPDPTLGVPTRVTPLPVAGFSFDSPVYPPSKPAEQFGIKLTKYDSDFVVSLVARASDKLPGRPTTLRVRVDYQVCTDTFCLESSDQATPPLALTIMADSPFAAADEQDISPAGPDEAAMPAEATRIWNIELTESSWPIGLLFALLIGLLLNLTPCVLPVIPLTVGYFVYQSQQTGLTGRAGRRSIMLAGVAFAGGIVATFMLLGAIVMLARQQFGVIFEHPSTILGLGLFIVAMALGMFGVYPVQLPNFIGRWAGARSGLGGAMVMGALAAVLSTPCTGPLLGGMITFAMKLPTLLGLVSFFGLGLGMAIPYIVLTAAPGLLDSVPRSGKWTEMIRVALGFILLGLALSIFSGFKSDPGRWQFAIWASLLLACTIWVCSNIIRGAADARWVWPVRLAVLVLVTAGIGYSWPDQAEPAAAAAVFAKAGENGGPIDGATFKIGRTVWYEYDAELLDRARAAGLPVMLDLISDFCAACGAMDRHVWPNEAAQDALKGFIVVKANTSRPVASTLRADYGATGVPYLVFFDADGRIVKSVAPHATDPGELVKTIADVRQRLGQ